MNCFNTSLSIDRRFDLKVRGGFSAVLAFAAVRCCQYFRLQCGYLSGFSEAWNASLVYRETQMHWCRARNVHARMHARTHLQGSWVDRVTKSEEKRMRKGGRAGKHSWSTEFSSSVTPLILPLHHSFFFLTPLLPLPCTTPSSLYTTLPAPLYHSSPVPYNSFLSLKPLLYHSFLSFTPLLPLLYTTLPFPLHHSFLSLTPLLPLPYTTPTRGAGVCLKDVDMMEFDQRLRVAPDMARHAACHCAPPIPSGLPLTARPPRCCRRLLQTMQRDSAMLSQLSIIDYSLLLGNKSTDSSCVCVCVCSIP